MLFCVARCHSEVDDDDAMNRYSHQYGGAPKARQLLKLLREGMIFPDVEVHV